MSLKTLVNTSRRLVRWCLDLWRSTQIELHGQYGIEHLHALHTYESRTHWLRVALVCILTPIPAIAIVSLLDLIPLEPPEHGPNSIGTWIRLTCTGTMVSTAILYQFRSYVPWMKLTSLLMWGSVFAGTVIAIVMLWQISTLVGFPIPFVTIVSAPTITTVMVSSVFFFRRQQIRQRTKLARDLLPHALVLRCQVLMMIIYPLYNHVFSRLSSMEQTAFVLLLPVIKIVCKLWINRSIRGSRDASPEVVIFTVEVFHSLFVANCMQSSTTMRTVLVLVLVDFLQACISWYDVGSLLHEIQTLMGTTSMKSTETISRLAHEIVRAEPQLYTPSTTPSDREDKTKSHLFIHREAVRPEGAVPPTDLAHLSFDERRLFVHKVLQMLYLTEFVVLIEYTEVITPLIYSANVALLSGRHNRKYYQFLDGWSTSSFAAMLNNIAVYITAEFVSLFLMAFVLWWRLRFSLVHQLAFNSSCPRTRKACWLGGLYGPERACTGRRRLLVPIPVAATLNHYTLTPPSPVRLVHHQRLEAFEGKSCATSAFEKAHVSASNN